MVETKADAARGSRRKAKRRCSGIYSEGRKRGKRVAIALAREESRLARPCVHAFVFPRDEPGPRARATQIRERRVERIRFFRETFRSSRGNIAGGGSREIQTVNLRFPHRSGATRDFSVPPISRTFPSASDRRQSVDRAETRVSIEICPKTRSRRLVVRPFD